MNNYRICICGWELHSLFYALLVDFEPAFRKVSTKYAWIFLYIKLLNIYMIKKLNKNVTIHCITSNSITSFWICSYTALSEIRLYILSPLTILFYINVITFIMRSAIMCCYWPLNLSTWGCLWSPFKIDDTTVNY